MLVTLSSLGVFGGRKATRFTSDPPFTSPHTWSSSCYLCRAVFIFTAHFHMVSLLNLHGNNLLSVSAPVRFRLHIDRKLFLSFPLDRVLLHLCRDSRQQQCYRAADSRQLANRGWRFASLPLGSYFC